MKWRRLENIFAFDTKGNICSRKQTRLLAAFGVWRYLSSLLRSHPHFTSEKDTDTDTQERTQGHLAKTSGGAAVKIRACLPLVPSTRDSQTWCPESRLESLLKYRLLHPVLLEPLIG